MVVDASGACIPTESKGWSKEVMVSLRCVRRNDSHEVDIDISRGWQALKVEELSCQHASPCLRRSTAATGNVQQKLGLQGPSHSPPVD
jgi:hypothetical protein